MRQMCITDVLRLVRINYQLAIRNNMLLASGYLCLIPWLRGIANLDAQRSAQCLGESVVLIGILLITPIGSAEQNTAIAECVKVRQITQKRILLLRFGLAFLLVLVMTAIFTAVMQWKNCSFPYMSYVAATVAHAAALGLLGLVVAIRSHSTVVGYLASVGGYVLIYMGSM